jgi:3D (Asp-Asp-Asp) domain-containing protein
MIEYIPAVGERMEAAWLFHPYEDEEDAKNQAREALAYTALRTGAQLGGIELEVTTPDDQRVVNVDPDEWPRGTRVAIASARITSVLISQEQKRAIEFVNSLSPRELDALRKHTRGIAARYGRDLDDSECDIFIGTFGPDISEKQFKEIVGRNASR